MDKKEKKNNKLKELQNNLSHKIFKNSKFKKIYFSYYVRLVMFCVLFMILFFSSFVLFRNSFSYEEEKYIQYRESSNLDYKVYLKPNNFYEQSYLGKNMLYIASLIDNIKIDFGYNFFIDKKADLKFNYSIVGKLLIKDESGTNVYFEKEYNLLPQKQVVMEDAISYNLKESISVDYSYYNRLANDFKSSYGVNSASEFKIYLKINKIATNESNSLNLNEYKEMSMTIPLSEKAINITMDYEDINNSNYILNKASVKLNNIIFIVLAAILFITSVASLLKFLELLFVFAGKKTNYDKYIEKLLKEYDRLIAEVHTEPNFERCEIIKIIKFQELLDIRDNLKLPIMYYNVISHHKSYFYIKHNETVYLLIIKAVDLEKVKRKNNKKIQR